jgi:hypothetical protein
MIVAGPKVRCSPSLGIRSLYMNVLYKLTSPFEVLSYEEEVLKTILTKFSATAPEVVTSVTEAHFSGATRPVFDDPRCYSLWRLWKQLERAAAVAERDNGSEEVVYTGSQSWE